MFNRRESGLPDATIYCLIGGIPETFGGRTSACLQRANAFAELDKRHVEVLTLSPANGINPQALTNRLRDEGKIGKRVTIRSIWGDLMRAEPDVLAQLATHSSEEITIDTETLPRYQGEPEIIERDSKGRTVRLDRFRDDGSRLYSYRRGSNDQAKSSVLYDTRGRPVAQWRQQYQLYFAWLDWMIGANPAVIINDGPPIARYLHEYQRENVALVQTIHSKHSADPTSRAESIGKTYVEALKNVDRFDLLAVLTDSQYSDLQALNYVADNAAVLPNITTAKPIRRIKPRPAGSGVMLARTTFLKRIDHAVKAVHSAQQSGVDASLEIYGVEDEAQASLEELVSELSSDGSIALKGFDPHARSKFAESSFTLLTSKYEGQSLILLESMAAGCIPIAYDIKYGPADIITHGVNGFLVPEGDTDAMAAYIGKLQEMKDRDVERMRTAAVSRVGDFSPDKVTRKWGAAMKRALSEKVPQVETDGRAMLSELYINNDQLNLQVTLTGEAANAYDWALLTWTERNGHNFGRLPARIEKAAGKTQVAAELRAGDFAAVKKGHVDLWIDTRVNGRSCRLRVKGANKFESQRLSHTELYSTKFGSLSVRLPASRVESAL